MSAMIPYLFGNATVRVLRDEAGEPLFVAKDVALALEYEWNGNKTVGHIPSEWRGVESVSTPGGSQPMQVITEQGLYFFLGRSDKPKALPFQKWLAGEVLPAIRRTGRYVAPSAQAEVLPPSGDMLFGVPLPASVSTLRTSHRIQLLMGAIQLAKMPEEQARLVAEQFGRLCDMAATQKARAEANAPFLRWVKAHLIPSDNRVQAKKLYTAYVQWCYDEGVPAGTLKAFCRELRNFFPSVKSTYVYFKCAFSGQEVAA